MKRARLLFLAIVATLSGCGASDPISKEHLLVHSYATSDPQFQRVMGELLGPRITPGNSISTLVNGDAFYPAQLQAIEQAQHSITLETYMYWTGDIGARFAAAMSERARAGVRVHLIIDAIGSDRIDKEYIRMMEEAGAHIIRYNPIERILLLVTVGDVTQRTHRKLLVVDGRVGFTGGAGIADVWLGDAQTPDNWRDTVYRIEGPVVAQLQAAFVDNWMQAAGQVLHREEYFPALEQSGDLAAQVFLSSPQAGLASLEVMYLLAINSAQKTIDMGTPYFVPDDLLTEALITAMQRGVRVRLIVPGPHMDADIVPPASRATWQPLLDAGMEIYEYQPTMYHAKVMVIDGLWTSVGSSNLDPLSFRINDEANLNVFDAAFAQQQAEVFEQDLSRCERVSKIEHEQRPFLDRVGEFFASLFKPFM